MIFFEVKYKGSWYLFDADDGLDGINLDLPGEVFDKAYWGLSEESGMIRYHAKEDPAPYAERDLRKVFEDVRFVSSDWYPNKPQVVY